MRYYQRRAARLVPLYWLFTTFWLVIAFGAPSLVTHSAPKIGHIVTSYAFIPYAREDGQFNPILALGWTMNFIFLFDLITGLAIRFTRHTALTVIIGIGALVSEQTRHLFGEALEYESHCDHRDGRRQAICQQAATTPPVAAMSFNGFQPNR